MGVDVHLRAVWRRIAVLIPCGLGQFDDGSSKSGDEDGDGVYDCQFCDVDGSPHCWGDYQSVWGAILWCAGFCRRLYDCGGRVYDGGEDGEDEKD